MQQEVNWEEAQGGILEGKKGRRPETEVLCQWERSSGDEIRRRWRAEADLGGETEYSDGGNPETKRWSCQNEGRKKDPSSIVEARTIVLKPSKAWINRKAVLHSTTSTLSLFPRQSLSNPQYWKSQDPQRGERPLPREGEVSWTKIEESKQTCETYRHAWQVLQKGYNWWKETIRPNLAQIVQRDSLKVGHPWK